MAKQLDPGAPSPLARLELIRSLANAGFAPHVMIAPVVPYLTDSSSQLDGLLAGVAAAGAVLLEKSRISCASEAGAEDWLHARSLKRAARMAR